MGSLMRTGSVSELAFPGPARFSARTRKRYFFFVGSPFTLQPHESRVRKNYFSSCPYISIYSMSPCWLMTFYHYACNLTAVIFLPESCILNGQFVASDPLVAIWIKLLDPVSGDRTAAVLIWLEPGQRHSVLGDVRGSDSGWRTRRI